MSFKHIDIPKGGGKHMASGHVMKYVDGKYQYEHVMMAENKLGRKLRPDEIVHHLDGNPAHNTPGNLKVMSRAEHNVEDKQHHNGGRYAGDSAGDK